MGIAAEEEARVEVEVHSIGPVEESKEDGRGETREAISLEARSVPQDGLVF